MKKKLCYLLVVLIALAAIVIGLALMNANALIARYKPVLEEQASKILNEPVKLGNLKVSFFPSTKINIDALTLGRASPGQGLSVRNVALHLQLLPLLSKRLEIVSLSVSRPEITLIKNKNGVRIAGMPAKSPQEREPGGGRDASPHEGKIVDPGLKLNLTSFELDGAKITLHDEEQQKDISLSDLSLKASVTLASDQVTQLLKANEIRFNLGGQPVSAVMEASVKLPAIQLSRLDVKGFGGTLGVSANVTLEDARPFKADLNLQGMTVEQLLAAIGSPAAGKVKGTLSNVKAAAQGTLKEIPNSLAGSASVELLNGSLEGVNVAHDVLGTLMSLPFVSGRLLEKVPAAQRAALDSKNTEIKSLTGSFAVNGGTARTNDLLIKGAFFDLTAEGSATLALDIDMRASIAFTKEFSASLAGSVKELNSALESDGRLVIPLSIKGALPDIHILPDTKKLMNSAAGQAIEQKAGELINKALGGKKGAKGDTLGDLLRGFRK